LIISPADHLEAGGVGYKGAPVFQAGKALVAAPGICLEDTPFFLDL